MPKLEYFEPVNADLQTIWRVLLDRIENPDRYLSGVEACRFPESTEEYAVRELDFPNGGMLKERITIDERAGEIRYELVDHPLFVGSVYNALIPPAPNDPKAKPVVQFRMDWEPLNETAEALEVETRATLEASLQDAVKYVREVAEHTEKVQAERQPG